MRRFYLSAKLQAQVLAYAGSLCGFCHIDERLSGISLNIEHILPRVAGGKTVRENLWRSCRPCNEHKGGQIAASDPETGETVALYNPRTQGWRDHFRWSDDSAFVIGLTPTGRATIAALNLNNSLIVNARRHWADAGWHPPDADRDPA